MTSKRYVELKTGRKNYHGRNEHIVVETVLPASEPLAIKDKEGFGISVSGSRTYIILRLLVHTHRKNYFCNECFVHLKHFLHKLNNKNTLKLMPSVINARIICHLNRD